MSNCCENSGGAWNIKEGVKTSNLYVNSINCNIEQEKELVSYLYETQTISHEIVSNDCHCQIASEMFLPSTFFFFFFFLGFTSAIIRDLEANIL